MTHRSDRDSLPADAQLRPDEHLRAALRHAPDADAAPPQHVSAQILAAAHRAATQAPPRSAPARAPSRWWTPRALGASGALASLLMAGFIGLLWQGTTPDVASDTPPEAATSAPIAETSAAVAPTDLAKAASASADAAEPAERVARPEASETAARQLRIDPRLPDGRADPPQRRTAANAAAPLAPAKPAAATATGAAGMAAAPAPAREPAAAPSPAPAAEAAPTPTLSPAPAPARTAAAAVATPEAPLDFAATAQTAAAAPAPTRPFASKRAAAALSPEPASSAAGQLRSRLASPSAHGAAADSAAPARSTASLHWRIDGAERGAVPPVWLQELAALGANRWQPGDTGDMPLAARVDLYDGEHLIARLWLGGQTLLRCEALAPAGRTPCRKATLSAETARRLLDSLNESR